MYFRGGGSLVRKIENMDVEWMELILEAMKLGMSKETIRDFLNQNKVTVI
jgi:hypothetical protein